MMRTHTKPKIFSHAFLFLYLELSLPLETDFHDEIAVWTISQPRCGFLLGHEYSGSSHGSLKQGAAIFQFRLNSYTVHDSAGANTFAAHATAVKLSESH